MPSSMARYVTHVIYFAQINVGFQTLLLSCALHLEQLLLIYNALYILSQMHTSIPAAVHLVEGAVQYSGAL